MSADFALSGEQSRRILRLYHLSILRVETAGQSPGVTSYLDGV